MPVYLDHRCCVVIHAFDALCVNVTKAISVQDGEEMHMQYSVKYFLEIQRQNT